MGIENLNVQYLNGLMGIVCEGIFPPVAFYEEKGMCTLRRQECQYCTPQFFCTKKNEERIGEGPSELEEQVIYT